MDSSFSAIIISFCGGGEGKIRSNNFVHRRGYMADLDRPNLGTWSHGKPPRLWVSRGCCTLVGLKIYLTTWVSELILMEGRRADSYIKDPCGKSEVVGGSTDRKTEGLEEEKTPTGHARTARIRYRCLVLSQ